MTLIASENHSNIPITVIIVTKNESHNIARCLESLTSFNEIIVVDSNSIDTTKDIALAHGAQVINFEWNGQYPKKRQWCLDTLKIANDYVFFVDADEILTPALIAEIRALNLNAAGYFVRGQYVWQGKVLKHGLKNNKLVLINRHKIQFPMIDDLDVSEMGEIEGHYQPVLKAQYRHGETIGQIKTPLIHYAQNDRQNWQERHLRYARWQSLMNVRNVLPRENKKYRRMLKNVFSCLPFQPSVAFLHSYILKFGFLDGWYGFDFARSRYRYYKMVEHYKRLQTTNV